MYAKTRRLLKIIILDTIGVLFMIASILLGWLPGPGGIPLFLIGLSILASNHEWAERRIETVKRLADKLGDSIFKPKLRLHFDLLTAVLAGLSGWIIVNYGHTWILSLGISASFLALLIFMRNRDRWRKLEAKLKRKQ